MNAAEKHIFILQDKSTYGGSFIYHLDEGAPLVAVGFVVRNHFQFSNVEPKIQ